MLFPWVLFSGGKSRPGEVVKVRVSGEDSELCALFPQRFKSCVYRRYNDFVVFHETLLHKFPYRMVPALPPKRMLGGNAGCAGARAAGRAGTSKAGSCSAFVNMQPSADGAPGAFMGIS